MNVWSVAMCVFFMAVTSCVKMPTQLAAKQSSNKPVTPAAAYSFSAYVQDCAEALGPIPSFSCSAIDEVVMWTKDSKGKFVRFGHTDIPGDRLTFKPGMGCFNPSMAGPPDYRCAPYGRIGAWPSAPASDVTWVVDCRRANHILPLEDPRFESIGVIGHKKSTGETCFLESKRYVKDATSGQLVEANVEQLKNSTFFEPISGEKSPVPGAPGSEAFWMSPADMGRNELTHCVRCHSAYPYIRSSAILHRDVAKALGVEGFKDYFQPAAGVPKNFENLKEAKTVPFVVIGREGLEIYTAKGTWTPQQVDLGKNFCTSCHRFGGSYFQARHGAQANGYCQDKLTQFDVHCKGMHDEIWASPLVNWHSALFGQKNYPDLSDSNLNKTDLENKRREELKWLFKGCFLEVYNNPAGCAYVPVPLLKSE